MTAPEPGKAGHEADPDYVDKDVEEPTGVEREGDFVDKDVPVDAPAFEREGDYVDSDVPDDDVDTGTGSYVDKDRS